MNSKWVVSLSQTRCMAHDRLKIVCLPAPAYVPVIVCRCVSIRFVIFGRQDNADILWDVWGVPHIFADNLMVAVRIASCRCICLSSYAAKAISVCLALCIKREE